MNDSKKPQDMPNSYHQARGAELGARMQREALENLGIKPSGPGVLSDEYVLEIDAHSALAARNMGITYLEFMKLYKGGSEVSRVKNLEAVIARVNAKQENFYRNYGGAPLGGPRFVDYMGRLDGGPSKDGVKRAEVMLRTFKASFPDIGSWMHDLMGAQGEQPIESCAGGVTTRRAWGKTPNVLNIALTTSYLRKPIEGFTGVFTVIKNRKKPHNTEFSWPKLEESIEGIKPGELYIHHGTSHGKSSVTQLLERTGFKNLAETRRTDSSKPNISNTPKPCGRKWTQPLLERSYIKYRDIEARTLAFALRKQEPNAIITTGIKELDEELNKGLPRNTRDHDERWMDAQDIIQEMNSAKEEEDK